MDSGRQQGDYLRRRHKYIYFEFLISSLASSKPNSSFLSLKMSFPQVIIVFCQLAKQQNNVVILVTVPSLISSVQSDANFRFCYIYIVPPPPFSFPVFLSCFLTCSSRACILAWIAAAPRFCDSSLSSVHCPCCCWLGFPKCKSDYVAFL